MNIKNRVAWIDAAKFVAIVAVIVDHTYKYLYYNQNIAIGSRFSVSLFIILSGITSWLSDKKRCGGVLKNFYCDLRKMLPAYLIACFIYQVVDTHFFDFKTYAQHVIFFDTRMAFYFVLLYIQMMILNRIFFILLVNIPDDKCVLKEIIILIVIIVISSFTTNYTNILNVYGGGGKLFGGTYMILFYIGMLFSKHSIFRQFEKNTKYLLICVVSGIIWIYYWRMTCTYGNVFDQYIFLGNGINPPSVTVSISALLMLIFCYGFFNFCSTIPYLEYVTLICSYVGQYTLYIFLYHLLFLDYIHITMEYEWIRRGIYLLIIVAGSILINHILKLISKYVRVK